VIAHRGRPDQGVTLLSNSHTVSESPRDGVEELDDLETVLLVDDNRLVRDSLVMMLEDLGFGVVEAESAQEALAAFDASGHIEAALIDVRLPDMDGVELAARLRGLRPDLPLVIVSGQPVDAAELTRIPGQPVSMLLKPFTARQLEKLLYAEPPPN